MKKSEIKFTVTLDDHNHPQAITWNAEDSGVEGDKPCKSIMLSLWDEKEQSTMRIDLWTKEMMVEEMQHFFYETFMSMADTYARATNDDPLTKNIRDFATQFGKATQVLK